MRKATKVAIAVCISLALALPIVAISAAARGDPLTVTIQSPVKNRTTWYGGAVIPVRILVTDPNDNESALDDANVTLWVNNLPATGPGMSQMNNTFTNLGGGYYQFNLNTKPYPAGPGSEPIFITIDVQTADDREHQVDFFMALK